MFQFGDEGSGHLRGGTGTIASAEGRHFYWRRMFLHFSLVVIAAFLVSSQAVFSGNRVASVSIQRLLHPILTFQELRHEACKAVSLEGSSASILKWLHLFYFVFYFLTPGYGQGQMKMTYSVYSV